jgi:hypothetical protein
MNAELDRVRAEVAAARGLAAEAVAFLDGQTLEQIETQADGLAKLVGTHDPQPGQGPTVDLFATSRAAKTERQRALLASFTGRSEQPRNERGQFASFDGGARQPVPAPRDPASEHQELIVRLAANRRWAAPTSRSATPWVALSALLLGVNRRPRWSVLVDPVAVVVVVGRPG